MADDVKRPEIDSPEALEAWLKDKPAEWAQLIAVRAALRVFPLVLGIYYFPEVRMLDRRLNEIALKSFRVAFSSYAAELNYDSRILFYLNEANRQYLEAVHTSFFSRYISVAFQCSAESILVEDGPHSSRAAAKTLVAVKDVVNGYSIASNYKMRLGGGMSDIWLAVSEDCLWLLTHGAAPALVTQPLWPSVYSGGSSSDTRFLSSVRNLMDRFSAEDEVKNSPWGLIVDWYRTILPEPGITIPRRLFDETADIIATQPEAFWTITEERSAEDVLRDIERIRDGKPPIFQATAASDGNDTVSGPAGDEALADGEVLRTDAVPTHSDEPTTNDQLGRRSFARALVERIVEVRKTSGRDGFAVHLYAPWGAGKTSVLLMMQEMLRKPEEDGTPWAVVQFNAWEHEHRKPPWWPLIKALKDGCHTCLDTDRMWLAAEDVNYTWRRWILHAELVPYFLLLLSVVVLSGSLFSFGLDLKDIFAALAALTVVFSAGIVTVRWLFFGSIENFKFYSDISRDPMARVNELFRDLAGSVELPICIFIDDLDRCNADYVVDLMEGIQSSMRHPNVTYVVAADRAWLRSSFEQRYSNFSGHVGSAGQPLGYLFLEKIFQVSTPVPGMGGVKQNYWKHLLAGEAETMKADTVEASESWVSRAGERYRRKSVLPTAIFDEKVRVKREEIRDEFGDELSEADVRILLSRASTETDRVATILNYSESEGTTREAEHLLLKFSEFLPDNPRVMKRMVNSYKFRRVIGYLESNSVGHEVLARWTILEQRLPALADLLIEHPEWADMLAEGMDEGTDMPDALQPFAGDKDVEKVLGKPGSEHPLREADIATITRGSAT
ncbi:KAP family P-loop NTPase fold protein [Stappia indica]|uniref:KAP NTPase domain-containing protein n=1 Tax=Stappia indica TaxID=538381 RepID=A0A857CCX9_9HYPH|nr:P-loop NTPase fold protein [Stappia indica]QGZ36705.1 hypothetical protein GH266_20710 [Stappia indica]